MWGFWPRIRKSWNFWIRVRQDRKIAEEKAKKEEEKQKTKEQG